MKYRIFALILTIALVVSLFCGCAAQAPAAANVQPDENIVSAERQRVADSNRKINEESVRIFTMDPNAPLEIIPDASVPLASAPVDGPLTKRDAESIGVHYAGFEINQVSFLFTKEDEDDGIAVYEVNFRVGEYEYEIDVHAETGEILEFSKENIHN